MLAWFDTVARLSLLSIGLAIGWTAFPTPDVDDADAEVSLCLISDHFLPSVPAPLFRPLTRAGVRPDHGAPEPSRPPPFALPPFSCRVTSDPRTFSTRRDLVFLVTLRRDLWFDVTLLSIRSCGCRARIILMTEKGHRFLPHFFRVIQLTGTEAHEADPPQGARSTDMARHPMLLGYLRAHGSEFDRILVSDAWDSYFERDPFELLTVTDGMCFIEEGWAIGRAGMNPLWMRQCFGSRALALVRQHQTVCSGTIYGGTAPFIRFLEVLMNEKNWEKCDLDQPILNWIVYGGDLVAAGVKIYTFDCNGPILTLANCPKSVVEANGVRAIHNGKQKVPHIVHQWKAFDEYKGMYLQRCDMTDYMRKLEETTGLWFNWTAPIQVARGSLAW
jgi:hypothetical protein